MTNELPPVLSQAIDALPDDLGATVADYVAECPEGWSWPDDESILASLPRLWASSDFAARFLIRHPDVWVAMAASGELSRSREPDEIRDLLAAELSEASDAASLEPVVRRFRHREMVRIAWRDICGWAELEETLRDLSDLADACIDVALDKLYGWLCERHGVPRNAAGEAQRLVVLGMGKLGGQELNFSSDIDLIFTYPDAGETDGDKPKHSDEFFTALGRQLIKALDAPTAQGFAYRVDMRLRPFGQSGPLAMHFDAMESYYEAHGREWERYAMIKARVVAGDKQSGEELLKRLRPFVYRRYLDYGAFESLREMKTMLMREMEKRGLHDNVKLGRGGIREIEFLGQSFQLVRGGQEKALQQRQIMKVLRYLGEHDIIPPYVADDLLAAYSFLRHTENRIQAISDEQTHELPEEPLGRARLLCAMGYERWEDFRAALDHHRQRVQEHFDQVFVAPQANGDSDEQATGAAALWHNRLDGGEAGDILAELGYQAPADAWRRLLAIRDGNACKALSSSGRRRLDQLMPMLISAVASAEDPDETLARVLQVVEAIVRRTAYISLLVENPLSLSQLVRLCGASPWIARFVSQHPILLDELLDARTLYAPQRRDRLESQIARGLEGVAFDDLEAQMERLRHFKQASFLRVAAADIADAIPLMVVSDYLTDVAEVIVEHVLGLAEAQMQARFGKPRIRRDGEVSEAGFAVIAYGKLGGIELSYGSDLDLVFLHEADGEQLGTDGERCVDNAVYFAKLVQRFMHILNTPTPGGILFEVDTRLRPSGNAGMLSSSLDAFATYQREKAWTWEHQSLVRARPVAGAARPRQHFEQVRGEILQRERDADALRKEVRDMRERQRKEKGAKDPSVFDLKQDRGGIADIEFMVQYGVLSHASAYPGLLRYTDNIRLLEQLCETGWITESQAGMLADAYRTFRSRAHRLTLQAQPSRVGMADIKSVSEPVAELWQTLMEAPADKNAE